MTIKEKTLIKIDSMTYQWVVEINRETITGVDIEETEVGIEEIEEDKEAEEEEKEVVTEEVEDREVAEEAPKVVMMEVILEVGEEEEAWKTRVWDRKWTQDQTMIRGNLRSSITIVTMKILSILTGSINERQAH